MNGQNTINDKRVPQMKEIYVYIFQIPVSDCLMAGMVPRSNLTAYMNVSDFL
jgi:hypothetical protein